MTEKSERWERELDEAYKRRGRLVDILFALEVLDNEALLGFIVKSSDPTVMFEAQSYDSWVEDGKRTLEEVDSEIVRLRKWLHI